jgi:hypothetical protein
VDSRGDEAVRLVLAEMVSDSTPTRSAVLRKAGVRLDELHGAGAVPRPSAATAYRRGFCRECPVETVATGSCQEMIVYCAVAREGKHSPR